MGRTVLGVISGYLTNAALVGITEFAYVRCMDARKYFVVDLATQVGATVIGGYLCCLIAQSAKRIAATSLMILGLLIGAASLVTSWNAEPHWYGMALLAVYAPCVWMGYALLLWRNKCIGKRGQNADRFPKTEDEALGQVFRFAANNLFRRIDSPTGLGCVFAHPYGISNGDG
jgi:hypothetical protein